LNIEKVDIVKIDVEGHEDKVIRGMEGLLKRKAPRVLVVETKKGNYGLRKALVELGYKVVKLDCWNSTCNYGFYRAVYEKFSGLFN